MSNIGNVTRGWTLKVVYYCRYDCYERERNIIYYIIVVILLCYNVGEYYNKQIIMRSPSRGHLRNTVCCMVVNLIHDNSMCFLIIIKWFGRKII